MAAPFSNPVSKLCRAIAAYLISAGAGDVKSVFPPRSKADRKYPNTTVEQGGVFITDPPLTGNYKGPVHIRVRGSAAQDVQDKNPEQPRINFDNRTASTYDAMMQSDDNQTLRLTARLITAAGRALAVDDSAGADAVKAQRAADNADMVDFTVLELEDAGLGVGTAEEDGCDWEDVFVFNVACCSKNVD